MDEAVRWLEAEYRPHHVRGEMFSFKEDHETDAYGKCYLCGKVGPMMHPVLFNDRGVILHTDSNGELRCD